MHAEFVWYMFCGLDHIGYPMCRLVLLWLRSKCELRLLMKNQFWIYLLWAWNSVHAMTIIRRWQMHLQWCSDPSSLYSMGDKQQSFASSLNGSVRINQRPWCQEDTCQMPTNKSRSSQNFHCTALHHIFKLYSKISAPELGSSIMAYDNDTCLIIILRANLASRVNTGRIWLRCLWHN